MNYMIKRNILGFCNLHSSPIIGGLNENRALGAVTFLGRYALMDFTLSNFANSGIDAVCILVHHYPHSVLAHVGNGDVWTANTKTGFEYIFFNELGVTLKKAEYNTDINNILANKTQLINIRRTVDYVVVAPAHYLSSMDFGPIIDQHIERNSKITTVYVPIHDGKTNFTQSNVVDVDENGVVKGLKKNTKRKDDINVSLETHVISADVFDEIVRKAPTIDPTFTIQDMITYMAEHEGVRVDAYRFEHRVIPILSLEDYYNNSFNLLSYENRRKMFREDWPVYTRTHNTPPATYYDKAVVRDSIISNGCKIHGKVEHSILSRNVVVEEGADLKDCIIFTNSVIKKGVKVENVLTDKGVIISSDLKGKETPVFVKAGSKL